MLKLKQRNWRIWLVVVFLTYVCMEAIRAKVSDASTLIVVWIGKGAWWLIRQPMGVGGLFLLASVTVLIGLSWWETRPKPEPKSVAVPEISEADREIIQDLRTIWNRRGRETVMQLSNLLKDAVYDLKKREYWGELIDPIVNELDQSTERLANAVAFDTKMSATQVRDQFNEMYSLYLQAIKWLARIEKHSGFTFEGERARRLEWWRESHFYFLDKLADLNQVPKHHGSLKIYLHFIDDEAFSKFLRAAERPPLRNE